MTRKRVKAGISYAVVSDGLESHDVLQYHARNAPNYSKHARFREWYEAEFDKMIDERDAFVEQFLRDNFTGEFTIEELQELLAYEAPFTVFHYAIKYMLHRRLIDHFREKGHGFSADREIYLLGQTWAEAWFMLNYRSYAQHGRDISTKLARAREQRNADAKHEAQWRYAEWQRMANEIWRRRPDLSKEAVAKAIRKQDPHIAAKPETIAKKIIPPK